MRLYFVCDFRTQFIMWLFKKKITMIQHYMILYTKILNLVA